MKYDVTFTCGHTDTVELFGKTADREHKLIWMREKCVCPACYQAEKEAEMYEKFEEVEMFYGEYKRNYADCKTKYGSYDSKRKSIIVYVPRAVSA